MATKKPKVPKTSPALPGVKKKRAIPAKKVKYPGK